MLSGSRDFCILIAAAGTTPPAPLLSLKHPGPQRGSTQELGRWGVEGSLSLPNDAVAIGAYAWDC